MRTLTREERVKLMVLAMDLCPDCERLLRNFSGPHRDLPTLVREVIWKWFGEWDHGAGCPKPEADATMPQGRPEDAQSYPAPQEVVPQREALADAQNLPGTSE